MDGFELADREGAGCGRASGRRRRAEGRPGYCSQADAARWSGGIPAATPGDHAGAGAAMSGTDVDDVTRPNGREEERQYLFVRRPVLAMMISITVTLLGLIAMFTLPVNRYPEITPPAVQVVAVYPGASAEDVANAV